MGKSEKGNEMTKDEQNRRRYEYNKKPEARSLDERTIDVTKADVLANAKQIVARARLKGWVKGGRE